MKTRPKWNIGVPPKGWSKDSPLPKWDPLFRPDPYANIDMASTVSHRPMIDRCQYWDPVTGRLVSGQLSPKKYVQLLDRGDHRFQREGTPKPEWLPTREEALAME